MTIRKAGAADLAAAQRLGRETIRACYTPFMGAEAIAGYVDGGLADEEIASHADDLHVLVEGDRVLGMAIVLGDLIHLVMVDHRLHRTGHGSRLLDWCERHMLAQGHAGGRLESFTANVQAMRFYRKHGWLEVAREGEAGDPMEKALLEKRLG